jgi:hypothetical protein
VFGVNGPAKYRQGELDTRQGNQEAAKYRLLADIGPGGVGSCRALPLWCCICYRPCTPSASLSCTIFLDSRLGYRIHASQRALFQVTTTHHDCDDYASSQTRPSTTCSRLSAVTCAYADGFLAIVVRRSLRRRIVFRLSEPTFAFLFPRDAHI